MITLWQKRWSVARARWQWERIKDCEPHHAEGWLKAFRKDMPGAQFAASERKPRG